MKNETVYLFYTLFSLVLAAIALIAGLPTLIRVTCVVEAAIYAVLVIAEIEDNNNNNNNFSF
jgi:hypothetical protein